MSGSDFHQGKGLFTTIELFTEAKGYSPPCWTFFHLLHVVLADIWLWLSPRQGAIHHHWTFRRGKGLFTTLFAWTLFEPSQSRFKHCWTFFWNFFTTLPSAVRTLLGIFALLGYLAGSTALWSFWSFWSFWHFKPPTVFSCSWRRRHKVFIRKQQDDRLGDSSCYLEPVIFL